MHAAPQLSHTRVAVPGLDGRGGEQAGGEQTGGEQTGEEQGRRTLAIEKEHMEFHTVDLSDGWETPPGYPAGIQQRILAGYLDEKKKRGYRTRHLRFEPGAYTTAPFVHDYWEEVYLL